MYAAVVFADLEQHSTAWTRAPRERMVARIAEYRHLAESMASRYGSLYIEWAGDGHMFLFENADMAVRFGLALGERWAAISATSSGPRNLPAMALRLGCHFGECTPISGNRGWIGQANAVAKRVESAADPGSLFVTETLLDLLDLPLYEYVLVVRQPLKGDHVAERALYRITGFDRAALDAKAPEELGAEDWFLKGVALIGTERENTDQEERCYREAVRLRPDFAEAHNDLAVLLRATNRLDDAAHHYQEALRIRADYPEAHFNYATLLVARGNLTAAGEHFEDALRLRPDYFDAHHGYAQLLHARGDLDGAAQQYAEALRLHPASPEAHNNFAILLEDLGRLDEAAGEYREALRLRRDYVQAHYNFALLLERLGNVDAAEEHYLRAVELWPGFGEAHNNLAILLQSRDDLKAAAHHYHLALEARPHDPETHYNYGLLLRRQGDAAGAERHLKIAHELAPEVSIFRSALDTPASGGESRPA